MFLKFLFVGWACKSSRAVLSLCEFKEPSVVVHLLLWCGGNWGSRSVISGYYVVGCKLRLLQMWWTVWSQCFFRNGTLMCFLSSRLLKITQVFRTLECQCCAEPWFPLAVFSSLECECYASCLHAIVFWHLMFRLVISFLPAKIYDWFHFCILLVLEVLSISLDI